MNKKSDQLADRTIHLQPEGAYAVLAKANELERAGNRIIHLEIGQPDFQTFDNISNAEQTHTDAVLTLLERYSLVDPVSNNAEGVFVNTVLQALYDDLIIQGSSSLVNALYVGAEIEEIDILDIQRLVDALEGNEDVAIVYESLLKGSRNHLRSFVNNLASQGVDYAPKYLSQEEYDAIINSAMETN